MTTKADEELINQVRDTQAEHARHRTLALEHGRAHNQVEASMPKPKTEPGWITRAWRWIFRTHWKQQVAELQETLRGLQRGGEQAARERSNNQRELDEMKRRLDAATNKDPFGDLQKSVHDMANTLQHQHERIMAQAQMITAEIDAREDQHSRVMDVIHGHTVRLDMQASAIEKLQACVTQDDQVVKIVDRLRRDIGSVEKAVALLAEKSDEAYMKAIVQRLDVLEERVNATAKHDPLILRLEEIMVRIGAGPEDVAKIADVSVATARKWLAHTQPMSERHRHAVACYVYNTQLPSEEQLEGTALLPKPQHVKSDALVEHLRRHVRKANVVDRVVADAIGVSLRTMQRWLSPMSPDLPSKNSRVKLACFIYQLPAKKITDMHLHGQPEPAPAILQPAPMI